MNNLLYATKADGTPSAFNAPFTYVGLKSACRLLTWVLGIAVAFIYYKVKGRHFSFRDYRRESETVTGPEGLTAFVLVRHYIPVGLSLLVMQCGFSFSLKYIHPSVSIAIFTSTVAFSYLLSIIFMKHKIYLIKLIFVVASFTGVTLIAYDSITKVATEKPAPENATDTLTTTLASQTSTAASGSGSIQTDESYIGIIAILLSAVGLSIHQILYAQAFPSSNLTQASFIMMILGVTNTILFFPVPLVLLLNGNETVDLDRLEYGILAASLICSFLVGFLYGYGLGITSPFFMSLGELLSLGTNTVIDIQTKSDLQVTAYQIAGLVVVAVSFFVLIIPDEKVSVPLRSKRKTSVELQMQDVQLEKRN
ncbi:uncharacterized protein LOC129587778 [Paramacrobiotus metropolitanus]|uniref:uncharacterized protein LOC129587778 n=1 Tax=Paramacrobiotus metropolitanus TaxID=2943436 RepID=UPI0024465853|nr:uncharacterized protein LOC129587778 [Paramacrobiotus metropolitanus]